MSNANDTAAALEDLLLDHDDVDDLFAQTDQLAVGVRELREVLAAPGRRPVFNSVRRTSGTFFEDEPGIQTILGGERVLEHYVYTLANGAGLCGLCGGCVPEQMVCS